MIDISQSQIAIWLARSVILGIALGVFYDAIRFIRIFFGVQYCLKNACKKGGMIRAMVKHTVLFFTDIIFWLCAGICSVLLTYMMGGGVLRGLTYLGMAIGFSAYYLTLGRLVLKINLKIVSGIKKLLRAIFKILIFPIKFAIHVLISFYHLTIGKILGKIIRCIVAARKKAADTEKLPEDTDLGEGEDLVYAQGSMGCRKKDRVSFGTPKGGR